MHEAGFADGIASPGDARQCAPAHGARFGNGFVMAKTGTRRGFGRRAYNQLWAGREMRWKELNRKASHDSYYHTVDLVMHIGWVWVRAGVAGARAAVRGQLQPDQQRVQ